MSVDRLPHGYTNFTSRTGEVVDKRYDGPRRWDNARRELACLRALHGRLPVPDVVSADPSVPSLRMTAISGLHGQDLLYAGHARAVLRLVGDALAKLQSISPATIASLDGDGGVIVHGDFGPQNMLFDEEISEVAAILDWESAHLGTREEDLAWVEWIVRMHHGTHVDALDELFTSSALSFPWTTRHNAMLRQCRGILDYCESAGMHAPAEHWRQLIATTESWTE
jgi:aminoglycoside phosphotransferase